MMIARVVLVTDIFSGGYGNIRAEQSLYNPAHSTGVVSFAEKGNPHFLYIGSRRIVSMKFKAVVQRSEHQVFIGRLSRIHRGLRRDFQLFGYCREFRKQAHSPLTSFSNADFMASTHCFFTADFAGFRNGLAD